MNKVKQIILFIYLMPITIFGQSATEIAKIGIKSTVSIVALDKISQPLCYGSGFIIDDETIVTNVHVIEGCNSAYILLNGLEKKYSVDGYVAIDKTNDLVILKVSGLHGTNLNLGSETFPEIGEKIYAVGNPKGLNGTFSEGIISGIRDFTKNQILQITAPISPGSSGGPVLNNGGQVIGIAFASFSAGQNLNFAIPVKYLLNLTSKITSVTSLSTVKSQVKTKSSTSVSPNIKEGVTIRNIHFDRFDPWDPVTKTTQIFFSIKNNLPYRVSSIRILFLVYDLTGTVIDYKEKTYLDLGEKPERYFSKEYIEENKIQPFLARSVGSIDANDMTEIVVAKGCTIKARVLDFKIEE